jgi:hypothetical protein
MILPLASLGILVLTVVLIWVAHKSKSIDSTDQPVCDEVALVTICAIFIVNGMVATLSPGLAKVEETCKETKDSVAYLKTTTNPKLKIKLINKITKCNEMIREAKKNNKSAWIDWYVSDGVEKWKEFKIDYNKVLGTN